MMKLLLIIFSILWSVNFTHEFHVSIIDIKFNNKSQLIEISAKFFVDDFEKAVDNRFQSDLKFGFDEPVELLDSLIGIYINERFQLTNEEGRIPFEMIGHEYEADVIWCYLEGKAGKPKEVEIRNTLLFELFDDQTHLTHVNSGEEVKSVIINKNHPHEKLSF